MKTQYERMLAGELYDASDPLLFRMRLKARDAMQVYNQTPYDRELRTQLLKSMLGKMGANTDIQTPFFCDYGCHIEVGDNFFANFKLPAGRHKFPPLAGFLIEQDAAASH